MKIKAKSLEFTNYSNKKLSPLGCQTYKLRTNLKEKKLAVYSLAFKYYKVIKGQDIQDGKAAYSLVKSLLKEDALQVFQDREESQDVKDSPVFTKCLASITKHVFPKKAYKIQNKYIQSICKSMRLGFCKWILQIIKLNDYLVNSPVPEGVTATKISHKEFVDILEDDIPYQWKLEFKKEGFYSSFSTIK
eukprot:10426532-Ditylum_brightwellii.AAC.1